MRSIQVKRAKDKYAHEITVAGVHHLTADEPRDLGGGDTGPSPHELVAAGLGSCTAITLQMYADKKGWPLQDTEVEVTVATTAEGTTFQRKLRFVGELDETQRARLVEIADRCPVHRTLTAGRTKIETTLVV